MNVIFTVAVGVIFTFCGINTVVISVVVYIIYVNAVDVCVVCIVSSIQ